MNDEISKSGKSPCPLDERFASRPQVYARLQKIADMMDQAVAEGCTADEAEALAIKNFPLARARSKAVTAMSSNSV